MTRDALINIAAGFGMAIEITENFAGYVVDFDVVAEDTPIDEQLFYNTFRELVPAHIDINYRVKIRAQLTAESAFIVNTVKAPLLNAAIMRTMPGGL